jgi:hypothetical protein
LTALDLDGITDAVTLGINKGDVVCWTNAVTNAVTYGRVLYDPDGWRLTVDVFGSRVRRPRWIYYSYKKVDPNDPQVKAEIAAQILTDEINE